MVAPLALLASLIPSYAIDIVGIYTEDFVQVFPDARPIKGILKEGSQLMEHPLETGALTTDHRIILPIEIEFSVILNSNTYKSTYASIKQIFKNGTLLNVQTKTDVYRNQIIQDMSHEEDPELYDTIAMALKLKEVQFATPQFGIVPKKPTQVPTVSRGNLQPKAASADQTAKSSALYKVFN